MNDLFNYDTSWLNPGLKVLSVVMFLVVAFAYVRARRMYAGDLYRFFSVVILMAAVGAIAAVVRYYDHGLMFGFTKELSLKWFQSIGAVVQAGIFVLAVRQVAKGVLPDIRDDAHETLTSSAGAQHPQGQEEKHK